MENRKLPKLTTIFCLLAAFHTGCETRGAEGGGSKGQAASNYSYEIINTYPHDPAAYTQGLVYHEGSLYESTGLNGKSSFRKIDLKTGRVLRKVELEPQFFGEGLTLLDGRAYQLTWQTQHGFVYQLDTFQTLKTFSYPGEGWGLTHDGTSLIMSNGSNRIRYLNPGNFVTQRVISVTDGARPIINLNELEFIKGEIWANIWMTDRIARIDPGSGTVIAWIDLTGLLTSEDRPTDPGGVLNGIAYDPDNQRVFVTGKLWPKLFEIRLKEEKHETSGK
ncbi:MAG: glutaminyl-peptide cyclotransferase [Acidobacteria bacterium]|nr:glutaminyl-peptide cyclotransferase [Acidobacteriota bacterium]